jgi:hypothetical protein
MQGSFLHIAILMPSSVPLFYEVFFRDQIITVLHIRFPQILNSSISLIVNSKSVRPSVSLNTCLQNLYPLLRCCFRVVL